jgi:hypothetical protein
MDTAVRLPSKGLLRIEADRRGLVLSGQEGVSWVTQEADRTDHLLGPGDRLVIAHKGVVLVEAMTDACIEIRA